MPKTIKLKTKKILTDAASIERLGAARDGYNRRSGARDTIATNVPCRLLPYTGRPKKTDKDVVVGLYIVFIMPAEAQVAPADPIPADWVLTEHDWLSIAGQKYDITLCTYPLLPGLPIELIVEKVKP